MVDTQINSYSYPDYKDRKPVMTPCSQRRFICLCEQHQLDELAPVTSEIDLNNFISHVAETSKFFRKLSIGL